MPLDKFNRHLYQHDTPNVLMVEGISKLYCDIMIYIGGIQTKSNGYFYLLNQEQRGVIGPAKQFVPLGQPAYYFPLNQAKIRHALWTPTDAKLFINGKEYDKNSVIGLTLKKDDAITVLYKPNENHVFVLEAIVSVPVVADRM